MTENKGKNSQELCKTKKKSRKKKKIFDKPSVVSQSNLAHQSHHKSRLKLLNRRKKSIQNKQEKRMRKEIGKGNGRGRRRERKKNYFYSKQTKSNLCVRLSLNKRN